MQIGIGLLLLQTVECTQSSGVEGEVSRKRAQGHDKRWQVNVEGCSRSYRLILNIEVISSLCVASLSLWLVNHDDGVLHGNGGGIILILSSFKVITTALCGTKESRFSLILKYAKSVCSRLAHHALVSRGMPFCPIQ